MLSIVIPIYNEHETLQVLLVKIRDVELPFEKEIILVDDASTDGTGQLIQSLDGDDLVKLYHGINQGKGAALRYGFSRVRGD